MKAGRVFLGKILIGCLLTLLTYVSSVYGITVNPTQINLEVEVPPAAQPETYQYQISVTQCRNDNCTYSTSVDQPWMSVDPSSGPVPGFFTLTISVSNEMLEGEHIGHVTVVGSDGESPTVTVRLVIRRIIANKLLVNPNNITFRFTRANLSKRTFTVEVTNANYERNDFKWSAETSVSWLTVTPSTGQGDTKVQVTIDPSLLKAGSYCGSGCDYEAGVITFRSNLPVANPEDAEAKLTVNVFMEAPNELTVFPSYLFWSVERKSDGTLDDFTEQVLHVYAGAYGFSISYNVPWIKTTLLNPAEGETPDSLASRNSEGIFQVVPVKEILQNYGFGRYEGVLTVVDRGSAFYREVPIIVEVRKPGDPVNLPVNPPRITQSIPGFIMIEATDAHSLHMLLHVDDNFTFYPTKDACESAGGTWVDPFIGNTSWTVAPYCSLSEKVYVLLNAPYNKPNKVYAYTHNVGEKFVLVFDNGALVAPVDPFFSIGPVPYADFGPMPLAGLKNRLFISVRSGTEVGSTREMQEIQVNINTLEGSWMITETYRGQTYRYDANNLLRLTPNPDGLSYSGFWGTTPVSASLGDGITYLYKIEFQEKGIIYEYVVTYLSATEMKGKWRFCHGGCSSWESFSGSRTTQFVGNPFN